MKYIAACACSTWATSLFNHYFELKQRPTQALAQVLQTTKERHQRFNGEALVPPGTKAFELQ
jgi:hypothetical protein